MGGELHVKKREQEGGQSRSETSSETKGLRRRMRRSLKLKARVIIKQGFGVTLSARLRRALIEH